MEGYTFRKSEHARISAKLAECIKIQDSLMADVKGRVQKNHSQMSKNEKKLARHTKELARGFSIQAGTTCTVKDYQHRVRKLKKVAEEVRTYHILNLTKGLAQINTLLVASLLLRSSRREMPLWRSCALAGRLGQA